jgi:hypothetical protein
MFNIKFIYVFLLILFIMGCGENTASSIIPQSFNTSDKNVSTNGNLEVGVEKITGMDINNVWNEAQIITAETITKSPYSAIGKLHKISGEVYKTEELPPDKFKGRWSEILLLTKNPNSHLGVTTIDFLYNGDTSHIKSGKVITCAGYFVGTFESENAMGGKVEAITFVGNNAR